MAIVPVSLSGHSYEVRIGPALLANIAAETRGFLNKKCVPIVSDRNVHALWGRRVEEALRSANHDPVWHIVEPGEASKGWAGLQALCDWLLDHNVERGDHILALGGGVVGDLTGFACAILKRGCGVIQLPTSLLAQVDSSVGGKTAINVTAGKNLIGAFHQPALVLADIDALTTLPKRELRAGYAETLKYGILGDAEFFNWCEGHAHSIVAGDKDSLQYAVEQSVAAKARIVAEDEREMSGARAMLNLGHTFGHALEAETGYSDALMHGEAVATGMVLAARYSAEKGTLSHQDAERISRAVENAGLPARLSSLNLACDGAKLCAHMLHDKKMVGGMLPFILLRNIGAAYLDKDVALDDVREFLDAQLSAE